MCEKSKLLESLKNIVKNFKEDSDIKSGLGCEYNDLAPIDNVTGIDEYFKTLHWAIKNKKIKNIAITGPYGSGKSSVISTYLKRHPFVEKKHIRISMATFSDIFNDEKKCVKEKECVKEKKCVKITPDQMQKGILQQLFYKVNYRKIPQSRYRKLHKVSFLYVFSILIFFLVMLSVFLYIFKNEYYQEICNMIVSAGEKIGIDKVYSFYVFGLLLLIFTIFLANLWRKFYFRAEIKEVKTNKTSLSTDQNDGESVFNKNMDEIVYFFEETKYSVVFFEDFDRLGTSEIFLQLRELNTLLNNCDTIKRKIVFVYAVRDDLFTEEDRTKFFEFIIPIIPVVNATNSSELMLRFFEVNNSSSKHDITFNYIMDISPFISDMRMLHNIHNEFLLYKRTLQTVQGLELSDIAMLSMIIFKNLHPKDFSDLQMEKGVVKQAFKDKQKYIEAKQKGLQNIIDVKLELIENINNEALENYKELKMAMLGSLADWKGLVEEIGPSNYSYTIRTKNFLEDTFNWDSLLNFNDIYIRYYLWGSRYLSNDRVINGKELIELYYNRFKNLKIKTEDKISLIKEETQKLKQTINNFHTLSLKEIMNKEGEENLFSNDVKNNKVLIYMLRNGYIDEKYANYLNYFRGESITTDDMNYILSVKNREPKPFNYVITKTEQVVHRLQLHEFSQKETLNYSLLEYLLSNENDNDKLSLLIKQLSDGSESSWEFVDSFVDFTAFESRFIKLLALKWNQMWVHIYNNILLTYERKSYYLSLICENVDIDNIIRLNTKENLISKFFEENNDIFNHLLYIEDKKLCDILLAINVSFSGLQIQNVKDNVLEFIFDNNLYKINTHMISEIVRYKKSDLYLGLNTNHYSTIVRLGYKPLINYIHDNLSLYINNVFLKLVSNVESHDAILDLIHRNFFDSECCEKIIQSQKFCLNRISMCCLNYFETEKEQLKLIWDLLLINDRIKPIWINVKEYYEKFLLTKELIEFIGNNSDILKSESSECLNDEIRENILVSNIKTTHLTQILVHLSLNDKNILLSNTMVNEEKMKMLIENHYFEFSLEVLKKVIDQFPSLVVDFVLENQLEFLKITDNVKIKEDSFNKIVFSDVASTEFKNSIIEKYGLELMTEDIAKYICLSIETVFSISSATFRKIWSFLDKSNKERLMYKYKNHLNADDFQMCFMDLGDKFNKFADRSKLHIATLPYTKENMELAKRLKRIDYITSVKEKVIKENTKIVCRIRKSSKSAK